MLTAAHDPSQRHPLRVVFADDGTYLRNLIARDQERHGIEFVAEVGRWCEAVALAEQICPDVVLLDLRIPAESHEVKPDPNGGVRAAESLRRGGFRGAVIMLSAMPSIWSALRLLEVAGAKTGIIDKDHLHPGVSLEPLMRRVLGGRPYVDPAVDLALRELRSRLPSVDRLTPRRIEVLELVAKAMSNSEIAEKLSVSGKTVDSHITGIFQALSIPADPNIHRRVLAALRYLQLFGWDGLDGHG